MKKLFLGMILCFFTIPTATYANEQEVYIALGDSLAAGQTPYMEIDAGYTDFIALQLMRHGKLAHFSKELAYPGYRIRNVIESVQSEKATELLEEATIITVSAGANDLLPLIAHDPKHGTLAFSQLNANFALNEVRKQFQELLSVITEKAPKANLFVLGYYFPYVSVHEEQKQGAESALQLLNEILKQETERAGQNFIDIYEAFNSEQADYLPNVHDVHPNQLGYRMMANEMLQHYSGNDSFNLTIEEMPKPNPKTFEQMLQIQQQEEVAAFERKYTAHSIMENPIPIAA